MSYEPQTFSRLDLSYPTLPYYPRLPPPGYRRRMKMAS